MWTLFKVRLSKLAPQIPMSLKTTITCKSRDNLRLVKNLLSCNNILDRLLNLKKVTLTFI